MRSLFQDLRYGFRGLRRNPGFTAVTVLTLALGIGANTAIFTFVNSILLRPLPYPNPDRIVALFEVNYKGGNMNLADPNFNDLRALNRSLQAAAEYAMEVTSISGGAEPVRAGIGEVSADFFKAIGVQQITHNNEAIIQVKAPGATGVRRHCTHDVVVDRRRRRMTNAGLAHCCLITELHQPLLLLLLLV